MSDFIITGARAIAKEMDCSTITILRMIASGRLRAFKARGNSSPWKCFRSEIARVRGDDVQPAG